MNLSYWEQKTWFSDIDCTIVGSGLVGLFTALFIKEKLPRAKVLVLERGALPQGASTKNAGFACFGSLSELIADMEATSETDAVALVKRRWDGLLLLRKTLGDDGLHFKNHGGYELFFDKEKFEHCRSQMDRINTLLFPIFGQEVFHAVENDFGFQNSHENLIFNPFEGQIDTGKAMFTLLAKAQKAGVIIVSNCTVNDFSQLYNKKVDVQTSISNFTTKNLVITTNGFAKAFIKDKIPEDVQPARAQVLLTEPMDNLKIKGTFHTEEGFYYFRNVENRILLGGGRQLDVKGETTTKFGITEKIQYDLEQILQLVILPGKEVKIAQRWSGIMGVGKTKTPLVAQLEDNIFCGVRLGGMGIAIGSKVAEDLTTLIVNKHA